MRTVFVACLLACLATAGPATAQTALNEGQGHPLKGTWLGDWGPNKTSRTQVLIDMDWDGKAVSAVLSPGEGPIRFTKAELNHTNWTVLLEGESGGVRYVAKGKIENLGLASRSIVGTWEQGNQKGDFKITRQ